MMTNNNQRTHKKRWKSNYRTIDWIIITPLLWIYPLQFFTSLFLYVFDMWDHWIRYIGIIFYPAYALKLWWIRHKLPPSTYE
jgi:hypothetical protein